MLTAARLTITGVVQGVGFRPYVHRLATQYHVAGWVRNGGGQVEIHAEGESAALDAFSAALPTLLPPLARIESIASRIEHANGTQGFRILGSHDTPDARMPVPPDVVVCDACVAELFDVNNRRHRYAFTTCTDCGPRYTVIEALPYDRERTSLRAFPLCAQCEREYTSPSDRRFHAESIACPDCGPRLSFERTDGRRLPASASDETVIREAASVLCTGGIVALRALGGFHLAVDATNELAVAKLRERKHRKTKPLACMMRTMHEIERWTAPTEAERAWLLSRERPVVLVARRAAAIPALAASLAPGLDCIGVMLPSTPLHHLLLEAVGQPLVMTSGNQSDEPLAADNDEARHRLADIADGLLLHDRDIVARIDDSVVRMANTMPIVIRRARGYAPLPVSLPLATPVPLLAVGAHLKNTFTLAHGSRAFVSPHIGNLDSLEALSHWRAVRDRYSTLFRVAPEAYVADEHAGYLSTRIAEEMAREHNVPLLHVQHHHAHVAAVAAEHGITDRVLGLAFDGTGAGTDGTVWGMEFFIANLQAFKRVGHLAPAPLPGGDAGVLAPWRSLAGYISLHRDGFGAHRIAPEIVSATEQRIVQEQIAKRINTPLASSAGRLFDAVASLLDVCQVSTYEGEAAMRLEALAGNLPGAVLPFPTRDLLSGVTVLDPVPLLCALNERRQHGVTFAQLAADFHESFAAGAFALAKQLANAAGVHTIVLGGGCFQNARLLSRMLTLGTDAGFRMCAAKTLPANDGGISFGQAAVAAARLSFARECGNATVMADV